MTKSDADAKLQLKIVGTHILSRNFVRKVMEFFFSKENFSVDHQNLLKYHIIVSRQIMYQEPKFCSRLFDESENLNYLQELQRKIK